MIDLLTEPMSYEFMRRALLVVTASGVAGAARSTLVPAGPNAAAAWRSASRTDRASISGGSPTALEP